MTADELREFEKEIAALFEKGQIRAPVHLSGGNEEALIEIFQDIKPSDWVLSTHRSHYHALLKGVPPELVKEEILKGYSITLNFAEYHFFSSAIVGGICPIALGVAMAGETVWCFVGDMAAQTGIFYECVKYGWWHNLPVHFVIEDNGYSVLTPTDKVWSPHSRFWELFSKGWHRSVHYYKYERTYPHQGGLKGYVIF